MRQPRVRQVQGQAWFAGWLVVGKGSRRSGNYGHKGRKGKRGGSLPGGGHAAINIAPEAESWMIDAHLAQYRKEREERKKKGPGPGPGLRRELAKHAAEREAKLKAIDEAVEATWAKVREHEAIQNEAAENIRYIIDNNLSQEALKAQREIYGREKKIVEGHVQEYRVLRDQMWELKKGKDAAEMELLAVPEGQQANVRMTTKVRKGRAEAQEGLDAFNKLCGTGTVDGQKVEVKRTDRSRSFYRDKVTRTYAGFGREGKDITVTAGGEVHLSSRASARTMLHEMGHWLEDRDPQIAQRVQQFLTRRTRGETAQKLSTLTGDSGYKDYEVAKPDQFQDAYVGKQYKTGSEVISMGLQYMFSGASDFAKKDPDYFDFMIAVLRGL